ncbi:MAG TPA: glycosyltransferase family 4 protein [Candidatus Dormibacteraeota bacterium]
MKVALVHYTAPPVAGGVEAVLGAHARLLGERGHDVRVIAGRGDATLVPEVDSRHPDVERLYLGLGRAEFDEALFNGLRNHLAAELAPLLADSEVVVAHNVLTMPFNLPLAAALSAAGKPLIAWTHDLAFINPRYRDWQHSGFPYSLMRIAQPGVRYVAVSRERATEIEQLLEVAAEAVPNGIDSDQLTGIGAHARALLERAGVSAADPLVLVPLRITRRKRLELALAAAAELLPSEPRLALVVTGPLGAHSADNRDYAASLLEQRAQLALDGVVAFLFELAGEGPHPVSDQDMTALYRAADVVLLPSESEGFGLPVLEAALVRAPMVCADLPVLREVGRSLHLFPAAGGASDVATALRAALAEPHVAERRRVRAEHDWRAVAPRLEALLAEVAHA